MLSLNELCASLRNSPAFGEHPLSGPGFWDELTEWVSPSVGQVTVAGAPVTSTEGDQANGASNSFGIGQKDADVDVEASPFLALTMPPPRVGDEPG